MPKATIIIEVDNQDRQIAKDWFKKNKKKLEFKTENCGCGCCVDIYYIQASTEIINAIPEEIMGSSSWDDSPPDETYNEHLENERKAQLRTKEDDKWIETYRDTNEAFRRRHFRKVIELLEPYGDSLDEVSKRKLDYARKKLRSNIR